VEQPPKELTIRRQRLAASDPEQPIIAAPPEDAEGQNPGASRPRRRGGRRPDTRVTEAILEAARELLIERGYEGASWVQIAYRAQVARTSIYERWRSREELVVAAISASAPDLPTPDTGSVRQDLVAIVEEEIDALDGDLGTLVVALAAPMRRHPELRRAFRQSVSLRRAQVMLEALERGVERGELRPDIDRRIFLESFVGLVLTRLFMVGAGLDEPDLAKRHVDQLLGGVLAKPAGRRRNVT